MEELKILVESIAGLPDLAIWVVGMYFTFKLAIVGSIYGVIRFVTSKVHDWAINKRDKVNVIQSNVILDDKLMTSLRASEGKIEMMFNKMKKKELKYIHEGDIDEIIKWLDSRNKD